MSDTKEPDSQIDALTLEPVDTALGDITNMPEVSEHVVNAGSSETVTEDTAASQSGGGDLGIIPKRPTDKSGATFDPDLHAVDSDGKPKLTKSGNFALKRGRKAGHKSKVNAPGKDTPKESDQEKRKREDNRVMGETAAAMTINLGLAIGGDEWQPKIDETSGINEAEYLAGVWGQWFAAKDMDDIPPNMALALGLAYYVIPRMAQPKTRKRLGSGLSGAWNWIKKNSAKMSKNAKKKR